MFHSVAIYIACLFIFYASPLILFSLLLVTFWVYFGVAGNPGHLLAWLCQRCQHTSHYQPATTFIHHIKSRRLTLGILHEWMRTHMLAKPSLNLLQRTGGDRGGRVQPGWRTFMMTCLRWILGYVRLEIWCKIGLSAHWCLCIVLRTRSGACCYWIGLVCLGTCVCRCMRLGKGIPDELAINFWLHF